MNAETFLANFGHVANAPEGVSRLRDLIYHYAFAGELVEHSKDDAADLAESLVAAESPTGRNRRPTTDSSTGYYLIPSHWCWVNIGLIGHDWGQMEPTKDFTYIDVSAIDNHRGVIADGAAVVSADKAPSRARKIVKKGTVIYSTVRPYLLNIAIIEQDFEPAPIASTAFAILHPHDGVEARFIYYFLRSPAFVRYVESVQSGIAYPAISDQKFYAASFPLAPTEEQQRIVSKVDELMALCDRLETRQRDRQKLFPILSQANHNRFTAQPNPANLDSIFEKLGSTSPTDLRKTVLALAIQGRLVPRDRNDEPAYVSFSKLAEAAFESQDDGFPAHWLRVPLGKTGEWRGGGTPSKSQTDFWEGQIPWVSPKDMKVLHLSDAEDHISEAAVEGSSVRMIPPGSLLMVVRGMILARAFPVALTMQEVTINQDMKALMPFEPDTKEYLLLALRAFEPDVLAAIERSSHGTCKLKTEFLMDLTIPLPPLAEQRRIVAKVEQLMALIDTLEKQQQERVHIAETFAKAVVASLTGTQIAERKEKMKVPKTALISTLQLGIKPKAKDDAPLATLLIKAKGELSAKSLWQQSEYNNDIDAFYQQLKTELARGWIAPPQEAVMHAVDEPPKGATTAHRLLTE